MSWICVKPGSRVLDLGCGEGRLLKALQQEKRARVQGIENSDTAIQECVAKGLFVFHGDLDEGLADFNEQSVDYEFSPTLSRCSIALISSLKRRLAWANSA